MKRTEALALAVIAYLMLVAGCVWKFGEYGLIGGGALALLSLSFASVGEKKEGDDA